jgi:hypothetical protein
MGKDVADWTVEIRYGGCLNGCDDNSFDNHEREADAEDGDSKKSLKTGVSEAVGNNDKNRCGVAPKTAT